MRIRWCPNITVPLQMTRNPLLGDKTARIEYRSHLILHYFKTEAPLSD
jgi:hypothetical protein